MAIQYDIEFDGKEVEARDLGSAITVSNNATSSTYGFNTDTDALIEQAGNSYPAFNASFGVFQDDNTFNTVATRHGDGSHTFTGGLVTMSFSKSSWAGKTIEYSIATSESFFNLVYRDGNNDIVETVNLTINEPSSYTVRSDSAWSYLHFSFVGASTTLNYLKEVSGTAPITATPSVIINGSAQVGGTPLGNDVTTTQTGSTDASGVSQKMELIATSENEIGRAKYLAPADSGEDASVEASFSTIFTPTTTDLTITANGFGNGHILNKDETNVIVEEL